MLQQLLKVLALEPIGPDRFTSINMHPKGFRVYGGQVLAQAVSAAHQTVDPERVIHSQHAYFLRQGKPDQPLEYEVERARDGGSFSSRRVVASQGGEAVLVSSMSFQLPSEGLDYQESLPDVAAPEELPTERERALAAGALNENFMITTGEDIEVRTVEQINWKAPQQRHGVLHSWVRTTGPLPDTATLHREMLAYMSDNMLLDAGLIQHGRSYKDRSLQVASLDHAIWFHQEFRADQWLLQRAEVERNSGGRTLVRGRFYTRDGRHVATTMQQGLMRPR